MQVRCTKYKCRRNATVEQSIRGEDYPAYLCDEHRLPKEDLKLIGEEEVTPRDQERP